jgi:hypothetical protein
MYFTYFAHAGHHHMEEAASDKGFGALIIVGIAVVIVAVLVIGLGVYDSKRQTKQAVVVQPPVDSDKKSS